MQLAGVRVNLNLWLLLRLILFFSFLPLNQGFNYTFLEPLLAVRVSRLFRGSSGGLDVLLILLIAVFYELPRVEGALTREGSSAIVLLEPINIVFLHYDNNETDQALLSIILI